MSMLSWILKAAQRPVRPNPMMEPQADCQNKKCCGNPSCKFNREDNKKSKE